MVMFLQNVYEPLFLKFKVICSSCKQVTRQTEPSSVKDKGKHNTRNTKGTKRERNQKEKIKKGETVGGRKWRVREREGKQEQISQFSQGNRIKVQLV